MIPQDWHKEHWIKTVSREKFIEWCSINQPQYTPEEAGLIYDSHVVPGAKTPEPAKMEVKTTAPTNLNDGEDQE